MGNITDLVFVSSYFKFPFYDRPTSKFAEANKEAFSIAEFLTIPTSGFVPTPFKGVALASLSGTLWPHRPYN